MRTILILFAFWIHFTSFASVRIDPSISPSIFQYDEEITVTYDVSGTSLASLNEAWIWVWIPDSNNNAKYNVNPATSVASVAMFTKNLGNIITFSITFTPKDFFEKSISDETQIGMLLKAKDWSIGQTTDYISPLSDGQFEAKLIKPNSEPLFVKVDDIIPIQVQTVLASDFELYVNNSLTHSQIGVNNFQFEIQVDDEMDANIVKIIANQGNEKDTVSFQYLISTASSDASRPAGVIAGINYQNDGTEVILCLWAPDKSSVYVEGDFNDWTILPSFRMKRDGEYFWIKLSSLTPKKEYAYRYLVDESIHIADPFSDKILDPNDKNIPSTTYPSLIAFPTKAIKPEWYKNRLSVFQTDQTEYSWNIDEYSRKSQNQLLIYELLIRDFLEEPHSNYQGLIDTLSYIKNLGFNAIELMPITEFNGNDSWGYNPTFMFAPDKAYGTKNKLKEFIDKCHENDIAVIMDLVMNQQDIPGAMLLLDYDFSSNRPTASNKWFNVSATHPYNVFFDFNHESSYTQQYLDTINHYWLNEYKIDGFRYDLSKGFTQTKSNSDVNKWGNFDASRIAILSRMKNKIRTYSSESYLILEHFADNDEEEELSKLGFMLWGNQNHSARNWVKGFSGSLAGLSYKHKGWHSPNLIGYIESHDEERIIYDALINGTAEGTYNVKAFKTSIERLAAVTTFFLSIPGPKMIWQFGEVGYDYSINYCINDELISDDCRVGKKPIKWEYISDPSRARLLKRVSSMNALRNYPIFQTDDFTISETGNVKQIMLKGSPYTSQPTTTSQMNVVVVSNLSLSNKVVDVNFPHQGIWYNYFLPNKINVNSSTDFEINVPAGTSYLFTDVALKSITSIEENVEDEWFLFPNPTKDYITISANIESIDSIVLLNSFGHPQSIEWISENQINLQRIPTGLYVLRITKAGVTHSFKLICN